MAYEQVESQFNSARLYAAAAVNQSEEFVAALVGTVEGLQLPEFAFDLTWPSAPNISPTSPTSLSLPAVLFPTDATGLVPDAPDVSFELENAPAAPSLPAYTFTPGSTGSLPSTPSLTGALALPSDPGDWVPPPVPPLLSIAIRPFEGVNIYAEIADRLSTLPPDLDLVPPTTYVTPQESQYTSAFLASMLEELRRRMVSGTGIPAEAEAQIWARAQSREAGVAAANVAEVMRNAETRGFSLPSGAMAAQLREAQKTALSKYTELSTDIAIKQAELEQSNVKHAIEQGIQLEGRLIDYSNAMMGRAFDAAKYLAENAVQIYNSLVSSYRANIEKYGAAVTVYRALIEGERAKVDSYTAEVTAERAKIDINRSLVDQQKVQIDARSAEIALYRERLAAVQAVISLDNLKLQGFGEQVRAYAAGISAEAARVEVFKSQNQSNQIIADSYKSQVDAYGTRMRVLSDESKAKAEAYESSVRAHLAKVQAYSAQVSAVAEQARVSVSMEDLKIKHATLESTNIAANNQVQIEAYRAEIALTEANKTIASQQARLISENYFALRNLVADASKVAAQVNAQLAASAYGTIQASAQIQGSSSTDVGYRYNGEVASPAPMLPII